MQNSGYRGRYPFPPLILGSKTESELFLSGRSSDSSTDVPGTRLTAGPGCKSRKPLRGELGSRKAAMQVDGWANGWAQSPEPGLRLDRDVMHLTEAVQSPEPGF